MTDTDFTKVEIEHGDFFLTEELVLDSMPWHWRARHWVEQECRRFVCFLREHTWEWNGGIDYETGHWEGEETCSRCGWPADFDDEAGLTLGDLLWRWFGR